MIDTHFLHFQEFDITGNDFNPNHFAMNGKKKEFQRVQDFRFLYRESTKTGCWEHLAA